MRFAGTGAAGGGPPVKRAVKGAKASGANPSSRPARARLLNLSEASFGIYLIHALILDILMYAHVNASLIHPFFGIPLTVALTLALSYVFVRLLQSLPYARRLVG